MHLLSLPHAGSYWAHQAPRMFHIVCCAVMFVIELLVPWFALAPTRFLRHTCAALQILLQIAIMFTGNYGFFNLLTCVLCVPLIDDSFWASISSRPISSEVLVIIMQLVLK